MGFGHKRSCYTYQKDGSSKAREILRLAQMALHSGDVRTSPTGLRVLKAGALWVQQSSDWLHSDVIEVCHQHPGYYSKGSFKGNVLLRAIVHLKGGLGCVGPHFPLYNKKESDWTLHQLHKLLPLEALAYFGARQTNGH